MKRTKAEDLVYLRLSFHKISISSINDASQVQVLFLSALCLSALSSNSVHQGLVFVLKNKLLSDDSIAILQLLAPREGKEAIHVSN